MHLVFRLLIFICVYLLSCSHVISQETPPTLEQDEAAPAPVIESILVTGSLVPKGDFVSKAPIATISSDQFEMTNAVNVESLINSMPQVVGGADRSSTWGAGIATANLRGLGENRTLVLVNSRRFVPTFPDGGTVDLNFIPVGLIDRVEVLTGGASAAYGSDALAGVINFILKEDFDGWEFNGGMEQSAMGDAEIMNFNLTNGGYFASGNGTYMFHFDVLERDPVMFTDRDLSFVQLEDQIAADGTITLAPNRASVPLTPNVSTFLLDAFAPNPFETFGWYSFTNDGDIIQNFGPRCADNGFICRDQSEIVDNVNALQFIQLPQERRSFKGKVDYEFDNGTEIYADVYYSKSEVPQAWAGPVTVFPTNERFVVPIENNPFLNDRAKASMSLFNLFQGGALDVDYVDANGNFIADTLRPLFFGRVFANDAGKSYNDRSFESLQMEFGIKGDLTDMFSYEIFAQLGEVESINDPEPLINTKRLQEALLVAADGSCDSDLALQVGLQPSADCVAANWWADDIGEEATDFVLYPPHSGKSVSVNEQNVFMGTISGNTAGWFSLPGDPGPIGLVIGVEYLEIKSKIETPDFIERQEFLGFSFSPFSLDASVDNMSIFSEALIPLVSGKPGIEFLELELGWRMSDHSNTGKADTYKASLSYYPVEEFQLRGSYNKAMRSPAIDELYRYNQTIAGFIQDPCFTQSDLPGYAGVGGITQGLNEDTGLYIPIDSALEAICLSQGVPAENFQDVSVWEWSGAKKDYGGDFNLEPEDATTMTFGFVWTPYDYDLSISVDYFHVEIENYIETAPLLSWQLLHACFVSSPPLRGTEMGPQVDDNFDFSRGGIGSRACESITRDGNGNIERLFLGYQNLGLHELKGWDLNVSYGFELYGGYLDINYFATKIKHRTIEDDSYGEINFECLGVFNGECDSIIDHPVPDFKSRMTAGWARDNLELQLIWKHISSLEDGNDSREYYTETLDSYSLFDASARYTFDNAWMVTAGIKNLFDKQPQPIGSNSPEVRVENEFGQTNTMPQFYDLFGRTFFLKVTSYF